ncbi:MAG: hypothetical protein JHC93_07695 [Parachlamydiales bacterium]|nr:hypothetical protein [Parachlamydiales bacterium]
MNNLNNPSYDKTINGLCITLGVMAQGKQCDKNLKIISNNGIEDPATPSEIVNKIYEKIKGINTRNIDEYISKETWQKLLVKVEYFINHSKYSSQEEKEKVSTVFDQIFSHVRLDQEYSEAFKAITVLRNVYIELDQTLHHFNSSALITQLCGALAKVVDKQIKYNFSIDDVIMFKKIETLSFEDFKFDYQEQKLHLKSTQLNELNTVLKDIEKITSNKGPAKIDLVEDTVKSILILKNKNKVLVKTCDQFLITLDFILKFNEQEIFKKNKGRVQANYHFFPENFVKLDQNTDQCLDAISKMGRQKNKSKAVIMIETIQFEYMKKHFDALRAIAESKYSLLEGVNIIEAFHKKMRETLVDSSSLPLEAIGPGIFDMKLREPGESIFTEIITTKLIESLQKKIIKEKGKQNSSYDSIKDDVEIDRTISGKLEIEKEVKPSLSDDIVSLNKAISQEEKPVDIVKEMSRLNTPSNPQKKAFKKSDKKKSLKIAEVIKKPNEKPVKLRVLLYNNKEEGKPPYIKWVLSLTEEKRKIVMAQVENFKVRQKNGKPLGDKLYEIRVRQYELRVYYKKNNDEEIVIIAGGDKASQKADIIAAKAIVKTL